MPT
ncbi:endoglucanase, partial [Yersinia pestis PY-13]|jgi:calcineurin-like phosphoesterase